MKLPSVARFHLTVAFFLYGGYSSAQEKLIPFDERNYVGNVIGVVSDADTGLPVAGATITLSTGGFPVAMPWTPATSFVLTNKGLRELPPHLSDEHLSATTNERGTFLINNVPTPYGNGKYSVIAKAVGYGTEVIASLSVRPGALMTLDTHFSLNRDTAVWTIFDQADEKKPYKYADEERAPVALKNPLAQSAVQAAYSQTVYATREGLEGQTTANGHVITHHDHFVALPSRKALSQKDHYDFQVRITSNSGSSVAPVWEIGPWNTQDDYWSASGNRQTWNDLPQGLSEAQAAFESGYNGGLDEEARRVANPAGIDIADGTFFDDLGMTGSGWVSVEYLWVPPLIGTGGPTIAKSVAIIPAPSNGLYLVGQTLKASFAIRNEGMVPVTFPILTLGGRLNGDNSCAGGCPDFTHQRNITLGPGELWLYEGTLPLTRPGTYGFFAAYSRPDGTWNTAVLTDAGVTNTASINVTGNVCIAGAFVGSVMAQPLLSGGCTPLPPDTPSPSNGATGVGLVAILSWSGGSPAASYDVYFGITDPPPFVATVNGMSYAPPTGLNANTTYHWSVLPKLSGSSASSVWSFTTLSGSSAPLAPANLAPADGSVNVITSPTLTWSAAPGATGYQVFFGTTNPPFATAMTATTSYLPGQLSGNTTYYWRIVATNSSGSSSSSTVSFKTITSPVSGPVLVSGLSNPTSITSDETSVYWTEFGGLIRKVAKTGGSPVTLFASGYGAVGIAVDSATVYFGDGANVRSIPRNGGNSTILAPYNPSGIAIDSTNVYWTDYTAGAIRKIAKGGGTVTTLATGTTSPSGIATDGINVYWAEQSWPGHILKVPINGGNSTIAGYNVNNPGVAIDSANVYWGENIFTNQGTIDKAPIGGGVTSNLATGLNNVWALNTDGSSVFWVEDRMGGTIKQVTVTGSGSVTLADGLAEPVALTTDSSRVYWIERNGGGNATGSLKGVAKTSTMQVIVGTDPSGLSFQVDGISYTSQQTFVWFQGSSHTISVAIQSVLTGAQYTWRSWSDGGPASHSVVSDFNTTYVAVFDKQFYLTTSATQGGTLSPSSGWYDATSIVPVNAIASSGYRFAGFSGDLAGVTSPQSVAMNGPRSISATFAASVTYTISGLVRTLAGQGVSGLTISFNNGGPSTVTDSNGNYAATVSAGYGGIATPSLGGYTFTPPNRSYDVVTTNQTGQDFNVNQSLSVSGPASLSPGTVGVSYPSTTVTATGGTGSLTWSSTGLPAGMSIDANTGAITGTPTSATGSPFSVTITVRDAASVTANRVYSLTINPTSTSTTLSVSPKALNFGFNGSLVTHSQNVALTFTGMSGVGWTASSNLSNITVSPTSGAGTATLTVTGAAGSSGVVTITAPAASNSPQTIQVNVTSTSAGGPFGSFDTPINNTTGISGAVAVTGWALDNIEVTRVNIFREPIVGEPAGDLIFLGTAVFSSDARPDVQNLFPTYPYQYRAGWGYQMLTNFLPNVSGSAALGNGTYRLHAIAFNKAGFQQDLGTKAIMVDNAHAAKPFGTIDTPGQGGTISGSDSVNFGWTLTPQPAMIPTNGSTITVVIDGVPVGQPTYNQFRSDVANLFPGYANTGGAVGFFHINTTILANGVHTISWNVLDNLGRGEGLGSRYFNVLNTGGGSGVAAREDVTDESVVRKSVRVRHGLNVNRPLEPVVPAADGGYSVTMEEMGRIELHVGAARGDLLVQGETHPLPTGSTLKGGVFYWQPGPGFLGEYSLQFERRDSTKIPVRVRIVPKQY
jgi:hypothetical protein